MKFAKLIRRPRGCRVSSVSIGILTLVAATRATSAATVSIVHTFAKTDGAMPKAGLVADAAGNLYGTTYAGGTNDTGTIFKLDAGTRAFSSLYSFPGSPARTTNPNALSFDIDGNLVGTTFFGQSVFRFTFGVNAFSTISTLSPGIKYPVGALVSDPDGNLYGTSQAGGFYDEGTIFKVAAGTNVATTLTSFTDTDGDSPQAGLYRDASGHYFGTTEYGGATNSGTVFQFTPGNTAVTTIANFNSQTSPRYTQPKAALISDSSGDLYGTTSSGGAFNLGSVFKIMAGSHTLTTVVSFGNASSGTYPVASVLMDAARNLYGTTLTGSVFKVDAGTKVLTTLATPGGQITSSLIADAVGNLYGTTTTGGAGGFGTVFKLSNTGFISLIADANGDNRVNFDDLIPLAQHYNQQTGGTWATGDFTYDGAVNFDDLIVLAQHYTQSTPAALSAELSPAFAADWALARTLVPEPGCVAVLSVAGSSVLRRRRTPPHS